MENETIALKERGVRLFQEGRWREAGQALTETVDIMHEDEQALTCLGICYVRLGEHEKVLSVFAKITPPLPAPAALNWAAVLVHQHKFSDALQILSQTNKSICWRWMLVLILTTFCT